MDVIRVCYILWLSLALTACAGGVARSLSAALMEQNDPALVRDGAPAYMLMIDALIQRDPDDEDLLLSGAKLYGAYASAFVTDEPERAQRLSQKAYDYAQRALCEELENVCQSLDASLDIYQTALNQVDDPDTVPYLFGFGAAWVGWIQVRSSDWHAIAALPKVEALMHKVIALDGRYDDGNAYVYLGVLNTQLPASLGGKPEQGRRYFEQAINISQGRNLMAKVLFAQYYARLVFDQTLHDRLLREVLNANSEVSGYVLANTLAQQQARALLSSSDDYF